VDYEAEAVFVNMPSCHDMYEFKALWVLTVRLSICLLVSNS
jgi:hypothetical protein